VRLEKDVLIFPLEYGYGFNKKVHAFLDDYASKDELENELGLKYDARAFASC
jgi:hypothetical protein